MITELGADFTNFTAFIVSMERGAVNMSSSFQLCFCIYFEFFTEVIHKISTTIEYHAGLATFTMSIYTNLVPRALFPFPAKPSYFIADVNKYFHSSDLMLHLPHFILFIQLTPLNIIMG